MGEAWIQRKCFQRTSPLKETHFAYIPKDTNPIFWKTKLEKGEFSNVTSELD